MSFPFKPLKLRKPEEFFTNPTRIDVDLEQIRRDCEEGSRESAHREAQAWSELGEQLVGAEVPISSIARQLASDPILAGRRERIVEELRAGAADDVLAGERAQRLTAKDFAVTVNARALGH